MRQLHRLRQRRSARREDERAYRVWRHATERIAQWRGHGRGPAARQPPRLLLAVGVREARVGALHDSVEASPQQPQVIVRAPRIAALAAQRRHPAVQHRQVAVEARLLAVLDQVQVRLGHRHEGRLHLADVDLIDLLVVVVALVAARDALRQREAQLPAVVREVHPVEVHVVEHVALHAELCQRLAKLLQLDELREDHFWLCQLHRVLEVLQRLCVVEWHQNAPQGAARQVQNRPLWPVLREHADVVAHAEARVLQGIVQLRCQKQRVLIAVVPVYPLAVLVLQSHSEALPAGVHHSPPGEQVVDCLGVWIVLERFVGKRALEELLAHAQVSGVVRTFVPAGSDPRETPFRAFCVVFRMVVQSTDRKRKATLSRHAAP